MLEKENLIRYSRQKKVEVVDQGVKITHVLDWADRDTQLLGGLKVLISLENMDD